MLLPAIRAIEGDHEVVKARGTRRALALLHSRGSHFDLVIVFTLARKGQRAYAAEVGFVKALFKHWPWVPVLVIAHAQEEVRLSGDLLLSGVRKVLRHPTSGADLKRAVTRAMPRIAPCAPAPAAAAVVKRIGVFLDAHGTDRHTLVELARRLRRAGRTSRTCSTRCSGCRCANTSGPCASSGRTVSC